MGKLYELNSNLKTLLLIPDDDVRKKINLKFLKLNPDIDIKKEISKNDLILNNEGLGFLEKNHIV